MPQATHGMWDSTERQRHSGAASTAYLPRVTELRKEAPYTLAIGLSGTLVPELPVPRLRVMCKAETRRSSVLLGHKSPNRTALTLLFPIPTKLPSFDLTMVQALLQPSLARRHP